MLDTKEELASRGKVPRGHGRPKTTPIHPSAPPLPPAHARQGTSASRTRPFRLARTRARTYVQPPMRAQVSWLCCSLEGRTRVWPDGVRGSEFCVHHDRLLVEHAPDELKEGLADLPTSTPQAEAFAKQLKSQGYRFVGPRVCTRSCRTSAWSTTTSMDASARRTRAPAIPYVPRTVVDQDKISWPIRGPNVDSAIGSTVRSRRGSTAESACK